MYLVAREAAVSIIRDGEVHRDTILGMRHVPRIVWVFVAIQLLFLTLELVAKGVVSVADVIVGALVAVWVIKRSRVAWWLSVLVCLGNFALLALFHNTWPWRLSVWLALVAALVSFLVLLTPTMRAWCPPVQHVGGSGLQPRVRRRPPP